MYLGLPQRLLSQVTQSTVGQLENSLTADLYDRGMELVELMVAVVVWASGGLDYYKRQLRNHA